jgi:hypothetical protein
VANNTEHGLAEIGKADKKQEKSGRKQMQARDKNNEQLEDLLSEAISTSNIDSKDIDKMVFLVDLIQKRHESIFQSEVLRHIKWLITFWLFFLVMVIFSKGLGFFGAERLSNGSIIALITTTTATIFGLYVLIVKFLFPSKK